MRRVWFPAAVAAVLFIAALEALAGSAVSPSTTLSAETGNNTSTAESFQGWSNGNEAATNVSKVPIRSLLYPGSNTRIFAHFLPWFGQGGHADIGYNSANPGQVVRQVEDMISRGINGAIIDWYGQKGSHEDITTQYMMSAAESHNGFLFAIMEDAGAIRGCGSCQDALISDLTYAYNKYEQSPAYFRINGRPVVFFFDAPTLPGVNLAAVRAAVPGNPIFVLKDAAGFITAGAEGAYSWVSDQFNNSNWGQAYLDYFYKTGLLNNSKQAFGSTKKGFNDSKASWGAGRVVPQNCGQTWLNTFAEIGKYYSASNQLENLQLVTWNDYEEGTALEMGVDNCLSISGSASGDTVSWSINGAENTLDHYTVYISSDGENLMPVTDVPAGTHQLNLAQYGFPAGAYTVYVKAVGRASIRNHMTGAISYHSSGGPGTISVGGGNASPTATPAVSSTNITAEPSALSIPSGQSGTMTVTLRPSTTFTGTVSLACAGLPVGVSCSFANPTVALAGQPVSTTLTVSTGAVQSANLTPHGGMLAMWLPGLGFGMVVVGSQRRSKKFWAGLVMLVLIATLVSVGCGGASNFAAKASANGTGGTVGTTATVQPGTYQITIQASAGSTQQATTAVLVVQ
ncbi:MAG TPA: hypothetical protein VKW78_15095 [Terriglobales bacterium]|nr:hypothetical protein [Terriglobales bacterium]